MKKLSLIALAILFASGAASAVTATDDFVVTINFTSLCKVKTGANAADLTFTYTAFGAADTKSTSTTFECTRGLTPTFAFDNPGGAQTGSAAAAVGGAGISGEGVIQGVRYTLTGTPSKSVVGTAATAGAAGTIGSADEYKVDITADIAGNQAGDPTGGSTQTRVLTITY